MADYMNDIAGCEIPLKELYETSQYILDVEHGAIAELYKRLENAEEMTTTELALSIIASEKYTDSLALGDSVSTYGRLQSRRYQKTCKDGRVAEKVTYELSIKGIVGV